MPPASCPTDNFVGFGLSFAKCDGDCYPSQLGLVSLISLENKKTESMAQLKIAMTALEKVQSSSLRTHMVAQNYP